MTLFLQENIPTSVLFVRNRFLEAIFKRTESESWPDRDNPEQSTTLVAKGGAPGGAAPYVTGRARSHCAARGGSVNPASKGASQALWRLPPLHPLAHFARHWQSSDALRRENAEARLFEIVDRKTKRGALLTSPRSSRGEVASAASGEGRGIAFQVKKLIGSEGLRRE